MKIKEITFQMRNDFGAILKCEHCGSEQELKTGYNDHYYHTKVLPSITCSVCKKDRSGNTGDNDHGTKSVYEECDLNSVGDTFRELEKNEKIIGSLKL